MKVAIKQTLGYKFISNEGFEFEVIEILKNNKRKIRTTQEPYYETITRTDLIDKRMVKNPYCKNICGVGYIGVGKYNSVNSKINGKDFYDTWNKMFSRCYVTGGTIYENVEVSPEWFNFQDFMSYVEKTFPFDITSEKFVLEKDLLQLNLDKKIYSPKTTLWLPTRINSYIQNKTKANNCNSIGIYKYSDIKWVAYSSEFEKGGIPKYLGCFHTQEEAINAYREFKLLQDEKARQYVRDLNYLPEEIIQLIRTV